MSFETGLKHTHLTGPWHYCAICDRKTKISVMKWQRGTLRCPRCQDSELLGQREVRIANVLEDGKLELVPVEKLRNPDLFTDLEDFLL